MTTAQSRIPLPTHVKARRDRYERRASEPANASALQNSFQQKLLREKEAKLINIYEDNQKKALDKVYRNSVSQPNSGTRRRAENIHTKKQSSRPSGHIQPDPNRYVAQRESNRRAKHAPHYMPPLSQYKSSAGRDRSNLLEPLGLTSKYKFANYKGAIADPGRYEDVTTNHQRSRKPVRVNKPPQFTQKIPIHAPYDRERFENMNSSEDDDVMNSAALQNIRKQQNSRNKSRSKNSHLADFERLDDEHDMVENGDRIEKHQLNRHFNNGKHAQSGFSQWQAERDLEREQRLKKAGLYKSNHHNPADSNRYQDESSGVNAHPPRVRRKPPNQSKRVTATPNYNENLETESLSDSGDEVDAEIKRKEQELLAKIKKQQAALENMRMQREKEEEMDAIEEEEQTRRLDSERARKRRIQEMREINEINDIESDKENDYDAKTSHFPGGQDKPKPRVKKWEPPPRSDNEDDEISEKDHTGIYIQAAQAPDAAIDGISVILKPCSICGRKFAEDRIGKHTVACEKSSKKRKVFDVKKMRVEGTDMAQYSGGKIDRKSKAVQNKKVDWRAQHEDFINSIRYAKKVSEIEANGGNIANLTPPPPSENPDYVKCPYCERRFNPATADRHIPRCKDIKARPSPPKKNNPRRQ